MKRPLTHLFAAAAVAVLLWVGVVCGLWELVGNKSIPCSHRDLVRVGMSGDEVRATIGRPHEVRRVDDTEHWHYQCNSGWGVVTIVFDRQGKVAQSWLAD
jgi:hypothetical protein